MHPDKVEGSEEDKKKAAEKFAEIGHGTFFWNLIIQMRRLSFSSNGRGGCLNVSFFNIIIYAQLMKC